MVEATAAGLTIAAASSLWAGSAAADSPKRGGTYRLGLHDGNTADSLDPGQHQAISELQLGHTFRSHLTEITAENGLGPDMADAWSTSQDAKVWTFELNPNASRGAPRASSSRKWSGSEKPESNVSPTSRSRKSCWVPDVHFSARYSYRDMTY